MSEDTTTKLNEMLALMDKRCKQSLTDEEKRALRKLLKWNKVRLTKHHRVPRCKNGSDEPRNISYIPNRLHTRYHALFGVMDPFEIAELLNSLFIDPDYELVVTKRA